jgi:hypothetical protein
MQTEFMPCVHVYGCHHMCTVASDSVPPLPQLSHSDKPFRFNATHHAASYRLALRREDLSRTETIEWLFFCLRLEKCKYPITLLLLLVAGSAVVHQCYK